MSGWVPVWSSCRCGDGRFGAAGLGALGIRGELVLRWVAQSQSCLLHNSRLRAGRCGTEHRSCSKLLLQCRPPLAPLAPPFPSQDTQAHNTPIHTHQPASAATRSSCCTSACCAQYFVPQLDGAALASVSRSLADLSVAAPDAEWWQPFCSAMARQLPSMSARELLDAAGGLARCGVSPPAAWQEAASARAGQLHDDGALSEPDDEEGAVVSLGALGAAPPAPLLAAFVSRVTPALAGMPPARLTALVVGFASAGGPPPSRELVAALAGAVRGGMYNFTFLQLRACTKGFEQLNARAAEPVPQATDLLACLREWLLQ
eukprot:354460-Chlamydomonas_euryale.AAC.1